MKYYNWQKATAADKVRFRKASPNLVAIKDYLIKRYGGSNVGIFVRRPVRGGTAPSSHSFGAALDWRYQNRVDGVNAGKYIIANHEVLGVQLIVDYVGCRVWDCISKKWKTMERDPKVGHGEPWAKWLHIETTRDAWGDCRRVSER